MDRETFVWLTLGFGIGLLVTSAVMFSQVQQERKRHREDPRLGQAEALLDEAERLLKSARKVSPA